MTLRRRARRPPVDRIRAEHWHATVTAGPCVMCRAFPVGRAVLAARRPDVLRREGHHILARQWLRKLGLDALVWDVDNGLCLCRYHHGRHELFVQRVPRRLLPARAEAFALMHGLLWLLDRDYPPGSEADG